jgi:Phage tail tube protein
MALQPNVNVALVYAVESAFGTAASAGGTSKYMRRVGSSLNMTKSTFASNEVRADLEVPDMRHGLRSVGGTIDGELALTAWDDFLEAAMCGTWAAGATKAGTDSVTTQSNSITRGAGSWITDLFKIGDIVRFTGLTDAANNSINLTVTALSATVMTVQETLVVNAVGDVAWNCSVAGFKLATGVTQRSYTVEQNYPGIDISEQFTGVRVGSFKLSVQPNQMAALAFELKGKDGTLLSGAAAPYFTAPTAASVTAVASGATGIIRFHGARSLVVTAVELTVDNNLTDAPVVGSTSTPAILYGRRSITGSLSMFVEDLTAINAFINETEIDLNVRLNVTDAAPEDFMAFSITRMKLGGMTKSISAEGGVLATFPFQALLRTGGAGTAYDQSSLMIQRSL